MFLINNFYKGNDLIESRKEALKNFMNPYEYNIESNKKNVNLNTYTIKSESHEERNIRKKSL